MPLPVHGLFLVSSLSFCMALYRTQQPYQVTRASRRIQPFILPPSWAIGLEAVDPPKTRKDEASLLKATVVVVKGAKRSGKSTLARTVLNRLATRFVCIITCPVAQAEWRIVTDGSHF